MVQSQVPPVPPPPPSKVAKANKERTRDTPTLAHLVRLAHEKGFSDIHLGVNKIPYFRNRGNMIRTDYPKADERTFFGWLKEIFKDEEIKKFREELDFDGAAQYEFTASMSILIGY